MEAKEVKEGMYVLVTKDTWAKEWKGYYEGFLEKNPLGIAKIIKYPEEDLIGEEGEVAIESLRTNNTYTFHISDLLKLEENKNERENS